jgi:hypothetical protein
MTSKEAIIAVMEKILREGETDKEKISFLKGYKEGVREACQPSWHELRLCTDIDSVKLLIEKEKKDREFAIKRVENNIDELIKKFESK